MLATISTSVVAFTCSTTYGGTLVGEN